MSVHIAYPTGRRLAAAITASLALGSLACTPALAQTTDPSQPAAQVAAPAGGAAHRPMRERFEAANTTQDGHLTLAQAQAADMKGVAKNFDEVDTDHKGYVTLDDVRRFMKARRAAKQSGGAEQ